MAPPEVFFGEGGARWRKPRFASNPLGDVVLLAQNEGVSVWPTIEVEDLQSVQIFHLSLREATLKELDALSQ